MRFDRYRREAHKPGKTPQRLAAARKAVQRDKDSWALFPEYVKHNTAEERIDAIDAGREEYHQWWRDRQAKEWRNARHALNGFTEPLRTALLRNWNEASMTPGSPSYLLGLLDQALLGQFDPFVRQQELERCRMLGQLTSEVSKSIPIPELPGMGNKELFFLKMHIAREVGQARAPHLFPALEGDPEADAFSILHPTQTTTNSNA